MRALLAVVIPFGSVVAQTAAVSLDHEAKHHQVYANEWTRVFDVIVPAGDSTLYHVHANDYVYVTFGAVRLLAQPLGAAATDLPLADGEVRFTRAPITHRVVNPSTTSFHNLTIEVLKTPGARDSMPAGAAVALENERVRAERVVLEPGQSTARHEHRGPGLDVAVSPGTIRVASGSGDTTAITYKAGDYRWNDHARTHTLTNVGRTRIEIVEIVWK
jgi:quercetin dioxygenase-like cupin family protein